MSANHPTPVTVVSGFLGAGKTTVLNDLLRHAGGCRLAVLVNDFGELNIDESLIAEVTDNVQALTNGCICCSMQGELIEQIGTLATRRPPPDHILIECSGVSEPARIVRTMGYPELRAVARLDSVTTIADPTTLADLSGDYADLARAQIGAADLVVLNKTGLVEAQDLNDFRARWLPANRPVIESSDGSIAPELVFDSQRDPDTEPQTLAELHPQHGFVSWNLTVPGVFQLKKLRRTLDQIPAGIFRIKGNIALAERPGEWFWLNWVGGRNDIREAKQAHDMQINRLVVISRQDEALRTSLDKQLQECLDTQFEPTASGN